MDVVKTNIEKIGGTVDVQSRPGKGTTVKIKIPLTLAIIPALIVTGGNDRFAIPQVSLLELVRLEGEQARQGIEMIHGAPVYRLRGSLLPLVCLDRSQPGCVEPTPRRRPRPRPCLAIQLRGLARRTPPLEDPPDANAWTVKKRSSCEQVVAAEKCELGRWLLGGGYRAIRRAYRIRRPRQGPRRLPHRDQRRRRIPSRRQRSPNRRRPWGESARVSLDVVAALAGLERLVEANDAVNIVVLQADGQRFGLIVEGINDTEEIVVKPLGKQLKGTSLFAGATIMGDGHVCLILDVAGIAQHAGVVSCDRGAAGPRRGGPGTGTGPETNGPPISCCGTAPRAGWPSPVPGGQARGDSRARRSNTRPTGRWSSTAARSSRWCGFPRPWVMAATAQADEPRPDASGRLFAARAAASASWSTRSSTSWRTRFQVRPARAGGA